MLEKMVNGFLNAKGYKLEITADGSPTLRYGEGESMHHSGGAASESIYIYQKAMDFLYSKGKGVFTPNALEKTSHEAILNDFSLMNTSEINTPLTVMSLGFGLGYNELLVALWGLINDLPLEKIRIKSYEKEMFLYTEFNLWLNGKPTPLGEVLDLVLNKIIEFSSEEIKGKMTAPLVKVRLKNMLEKQLWVQAGALVVPFASEEKWQLLLFDAFSSKTSPELWQVEFINQLLKYNTSLPCVFTTYACRGELKRVLHDNEFYFMKRLGFKGKRDATLAFKLSLQND